MIPGRVVPFLLLSLAAFAQTSQSGVDLSAMDPSVGACQNFYQYACGNWRKNNPIPPDRASWGRFTELQERNLEIERGILEKAAQAGAARTPAEQEIGDFYGACMNVPQINAKGIAPIQPMLDHIANIRSKNELPAELARLDRVGVDAFFNFDVEPDMKNVNDQIADVDQGGLTMPDRDFYLKDDPHSVEIRQKYEQYLRTMFDLLAKQEGKGAADAAAEARAVMNIETALAKASMDRVERRNPDAVYHKMTIDQAAGLSPDFAWKTFFSDAGVPRVRTLNVDNPGFIKALDALLGSTSLADLKTYLEWHALEENAALLPAPFRDASFEFTGRALRGVREQPARWKQCVQQTDRALGDALGQEFVKVAFSAESKTKTLQLVNEIEHEMANDIQSATWMSPATKDQAFTKLRQVTNKIGYPDKWRDYSSVHIEPDAYFANTLHAREFEIQRNLSKLGKPVDKTEWEMTPPTVNAYYEPPENNINFPAGILQPPFYNPKADDAVNYGAIGVVIGHELTHGFDDQGRRFDGEGNLRDWWTAADAKAFEQRADCVAKEYSGFSPVPGVHLNGRLTLGENSADNGGIHLAYMALMDTLAGKVLPKKDGFTTEQQFFLGYAQVWCENTSEAAARLSAQTNPHSPGEFRVNGVVQNLPEFQKAFACKRTDPMVSKDPCRVW